MISAPLSVGKMKLTQRELVDHRSEVFRDPEVGYQFFLSPKAQDNQ
jgi:hypothetical protein